MSLHAVEHWWLAGVLLLGHVQIFGLAARLLHHHSVEMAPRKALRANNWSSSVPSAKLVSLRRKGLRLI